MEKKEIRRIVKERKKQVPLEEKIERSKSIMKKLSENESFLKSSVVMLYWSMDDEVYTHDFVEEWYQSKTVLLPCVDGNDLILRQYTGLKCMHPGPEFGILEPFGSAFNDYDSIDMIVVPGVAFDKKKNRMGRGRGFYDRLLKLTSNSIKIGVAFDFQIFDSIPIESFDVPMDEVLTE